MSTTLSFGPVSVTWPWNYQVVATGLNQNPLSNGPWQYSTTALANGTAAGQADTLYAKQTNIASTANTTLNLSSIANPFGATVNFVRLKAFYFENNVASNCTNLAIGNAAANAFTGGFISSGTTTLTLRNAMHLSVGLCQDATGYTTANAYNLFFVNNDASNGATLNVGIVGCSA